VNPEVVAISSSRHVSVAEKAAVCETSTPVCEIVFEVDGKDTAVKIYQRPLGAEFSKHSSGSAMVRKVQAQSYAFEIGLKAGWIVRGVDGEDMSVNSFQHVQDCIKGGMSRLPQQL
jgi:hypothetical protein